MMRLLAVLFAFMLGLTIGHTVGGLQANRQLKDMADLANHARAAFDSCAADYGRMAEQLRAVRSGR